MLYPNIDAAVRLTLVISCTGVMLSSIEWLWLVDEFARNGLYGWKHVSTRHSSATMIARCLTPMVESKAMMRLLLAVRFTSAGACIYLSPANCCIPLGLLTFASLFIHYRTKFGLEGSDQMLATVTGSIWLAMVMGDGLDLRPAIYFIAAQSLFAYFVSGVAKLFGDSWRRGTAAFEVLNTRNFGHRGISHLLSSLPALGRLSTYGVLLFECSAPMVLIMPYKFAIGYVFIGLAFHFANAYLMGLNVFIWAFASTYPSVLFAASQCSSLIYGPAVNEIPSGAFQ